MKFYINENFEDKTSGKIKFLSVLSLVLQDLGLKSSKNEPDVLLHIGRNYDNYINKSKLICRLDGLNINTDYDYKKSNLKIFKGIKSSDAIIYQNEFCNKAYESYFPQLKKYKHACILNGNYIRSDKNKDGNFIANVKWRPHKRAKETAISFVEACKKGLDKKLFITGLVDKYDIIKHPNIVYTGWIQDVELKNRLHRCSHGLHFAWLDWCPNSVVEYICNGMSVVYTSSGGTGFIVKNNGIPVIDELWDFKPHRLYDPPKLNIDLASSAILDIHNINKINNDHIDIYNIAKQYIAFFEEVCHAK